MASHSWEDPARWGGAAPPPPARIGDPDDDINSDEDETISPMSVGGRLVEIILNHWLSGRLSAAQTCELCWFAKEAGVQEAKPYALGPGSSSGHYNRKLKRAAGHSSTRDLYDMDVPGHWKHDAERTVHVVPTLPLHEQVARSLEQEPGTMTMLAERRARGDLPPVYLNHDVVQRNPGAPVVPLAMCLDAVPYAIKDSAIGWWGVNVLTGRRYLYGLLRKRQVCRCGCKGWCSYYPMLEMTAWPLRALAQGAMPAARHNGEAWRPSDVERAGKAGLAIPICAVLYVKPDWAE